MFIINLKRNFLGQKGGTKIAAQPSYFLFPYADELFE